MAKYLPMANELVSSKEASRIIGIRRSTLTRWVQAGRLPEAMKLEGETGARLFRRCDVEKARDEYHADLRARIEAAEQAS